MDGACTGFPNSVCTQADYGFLPARAPLGMRVATKQMKACPRHGTSKEAGRSGGTSAFLSG